MKEGGNEPSRDHKRKVFFGMLCLLLILMVVGAPLREPARNNESNIFLDEPIPSDIQKTQEAFPEEQSSHLAPTSELLRSLNEPNSVELSEEEEHHLMISNYDAYVRYKAQRSDPGRRMKSSPEQIVGERITPRLLEHLEQQSSP